MENVNWYFLCILIWLDLKKLFIFTNYLKTILNINLKYTLKVYIKNITNNGDSIFSNKNFNERIY